MASSRKTLAGIAGEVWLPVSILLLAAAFVYGARDFSGDAWKFPTAIGLITASLALIEIVLTCIRPVSAQAAAAGGEKARALWIVLWFGGTLACFYVFGILIAIGVSASIYFYVFAKLRALPALAVGIGHTAFFWITFELLAGFRLYEGVF